MSKEAARSSRIRRLQCRLDNLSRAIIFLRIMLRMEERPMSREM